MDTKLKKLAIKLSKSIKPLELRPQNIFSSLKLKMSEYKDYFSLFTPKDLLKLVFYIFSYKKTQKFDLAEEMISNFYFIGFISTTDNEVWSECKTCKGEGNINCPSCDGSGHQSCDNCSGERYVCDNCGLPEDMCDCYDFEETYCDFCDGEGEVSCKSCDGKSYITCPNCEGSMEVEVSDAHEVGITKILTWDDRIVFRSQKSYYDLTPAFEDYSDLKDMENYIFIEFGYEHMKLNDDFNEGMYCYFLNDDAQISFTKGKFKINTEVSLKSYGDIV
jgi:hypothetical protein